MSEKKLSPIEWVRKNYEDHRAYIISQRDASEATPYDRQGWQRMLMELDGAHYRLERL